MDLDPDSTIEVPYTLQNLGEGHLVSSPPHPVHLSYRWTGAVDSEEGLRSSLPRPLAPWDEIGGRMLIRTPSPPGVFTLRYPRFRRKSDGSTRRAIATVGAG